MLQIEPIYFNYKINQHSMDFVSQLIQPRNRLSVLRGMKNVRIQQRHRRNRQALHQQVYDDLMPLIRKKRMGEELTAADVEKLNDLDKMIFDKLIK